MFQIPYYMVVSRKISKMSLLESARQRCNAETTRNEKGQSTIIQQPIQGVWFSLFSLFSLVHFISCFWFYSQSAFFSFALLINRINPRVSALLTAQLAFFS